MYLDHTNSTLKLIRSLKHSLTNNNNIVFSRCLGAIKKLLQKKAVVYLVNFLKMKLTLT